jgi:hypothetical protein
LLLSHTRPSLLPALANPFCREINGDVDDATLVKRIFFSDDVKRQEGLLAHTLQKIDVTGKLMPSKLYPHRS